MVSPSDAVTSFPLVVPDGSGGSVGCHRPHGSEQDFHAGSSEAGAAYYLVKPVQIEDLMRKMSEALGRGQQRP